MSMSTLAWTALVVEDELRLREALVEHLRQASSGWKEILQAGSGEEALALCRAHRPDVAFLDIRMPGMSGLELATQLPSDIRLVFVTAYDAHAIEAFEAGAIDYLLKPITLDRLQKTLDRLQARAPLPIEELRHWLGGMSAAPKLPTPEPLRWITASSGRKTHLIPVDEVLFFQADSKYTRAECAGASYVITQTIKELAGRLDPDVFQQVHRSTLVNLRAVAWVERLEGGTGSLHLRQHEAKLPVSASHLKALLSRC
jgi:DNA-binding LytR/AlgR family response regulator